MKKKLLMIAMTAIMISSLCACSFEFELGGHDAQLDDGVIDELKELPDEAIEDDTDKDDKNDKEDKEDKTSKDDEPSALSEHTNDSSDWTSYNQIDNIVYVKYTNGISDDYNITPEGTFGDVCDWLEYAVPDYPSETYRKIVSLFFASQELFEEDMSRLTEDQRNQILATLASISWQINHDGAVVNNMHCIVGDETLYNFEVTAPGTGDYIFQWNVNTDELAIGKDDDSLVDYQTTVFDSKYIAAYMVAVDEALKGNTAGNSNVGNDVENNPSDKTDSEISNSSSLTQLEKVLSSTRAVGHEHEIVTAIENYYGSTVASFEQDFDDGYENINITLKSGETCRFFSSETGISVYDTTTTFETIWSKYD